MAGDANGDGVRDSSDDEFIEIVNRTASLIDISGYGIGDSARTALFSAGDYSSRGEAAVIFGGGEPKGDLEIRSKRACLCFLPFPEQRWRHNHTAGRIRPGKGIDFIWSSGRQCQSITQQESGTRFRGFVLHSSMGGGVFSPGIGVTVKHLQLRPVSGPWHRTRPRWMNMVLS